MDHLAVGVAGERAAISHYLSLGFEEVARNWRCNAGEIDLIVRREELLVFCEVKTRRSGGFSYGFDAVTPNKMLKLRRLAELFLLESNLRPSAVRFDVASVEMRERPVVTLFADAF
jgi:putative endonuclease